MLYTQDLIEIMTIAAECEPEYKDWTYGRHTWCIDAVEEIEEYLQRKGISFRKRKQEGAMDSFMDHSFHAWITLSCGTIIDPTIKQFFLPEGPGTKPLLDPGEWLLRDLWIVDPKDPEISFYKYL